MLAFGGWEAGLAYEGEGNGRLSEAHLVADKASPENARGMREAQKIGRVVQAFADFHEEGGLPVLNAAAEAERPTLVGQEREGCAGQRCDGLVCRVEKGHLVDDGIHAARGRPGMHDRLDHTSAKLPACKRANSNAVKADEDFRAEDQVDDLGQDGGVLEVVAFPCRPPSLQLDVKGEEGEDIRTGGPLEEAVVLGVGPCTASCLPHPRPRRSVSGAGARASLFFTTVQEMLATRTTQLRFWNDSPTTVGQNELRGRPASKQALGSRSRGSRKTPPRLPQNSMLFKCICAGLQKK